MSTSDAATHAAYHKATLPPEVAPEQDNGIAFAEHPKQKKTPENRDNISRMGTVLFDAVVFILAWLIAWGIAQLFTDVALALIIAFVVAILAILSIHITLQWESAVILRLGKLNRIAGPGLYFTIPIIEYTTICIDQRMRCTYFSGEQILTADLVPVNVDAVLFWTVFDPKRATTEIENFPHAVSYIAQTCMRDVIGSTELEELATRRRQIDKEIRDEIAVVTDPWGVSVANVKIRDIVVPKELQDSLSKAAQAQRERDSRVILAEVEKDISEMLVEAANVYSKNERALQLRAMHAVGENVKESSGMLVVPSSLGDSFGNAADFLKRL